MKDGKINQHVGLLVLSVPLLQVASNTKQTSKKKLTFLSKTRSVVLGFCKRTSKIIDLNFKKQQHKTPFFLMTEKPQPKVKPLKTKTKNNT